MNITYFQLKRAIEKNNECFLCDIESELEQNYLKNYLQELVMDAKARDEIVESKGFCNNHSYELLIEASKPASSDGHGVALIMQSIVEQLIGDLAHIQNWKSEFSKGKNDRICPACIHVNNSMRMYLREATDLLNASDDFLQLIKQSKGFCICHFWLLTSAICSMNVQQPQRISNVMNEVESTNLKRINQELTEYIKRQSYEFSERDRTEVASVLLRSIEKIVGKRGMKPLAEQYGDTCRTVKGDKFFW